MTPGTDDTKPAPQTRTIHLIANERSGKGKGAGLPALARAVCGRHGVRLQTYDASSKERFETSIRAAVENAKTDGGTVVAAGGDGTIRSVAQHAMGSGVRFAAVATGTFNWFCRNHGLSLEPDEALRDAICGETDDVNVGEINGHAFIVNASLGLYARAIQDRHKNMERFGRSRIVAILSTLKSLFTYHQALEIELHTDAGIRHFKSLMVVIGHNQLQMQSLSFDMAACIARGNFAVSLLKPVTKIELARVLLRAVHSSMEKDERMETFCVDWMKIQTSRDRHRVALDGELFKIETPLCFEVKRNALKLVRPVGPERAVSMS